MGEEEFGPRLAFLGQLIGSTGIGFLIGLAIREACDFPEGDVRRSMGYLRAGSFILLLVGFVLATMFKP